MICPICAASIRDGLKFCPKCGNPIIAESYQEPVQQPSQPPVNDYQPPVQQTYEPPVQQSYQAPVQQSYQPPVQQAYQAPANGYQPQYNDYGYTSDNSYSVLEEEKAPNKAGKIIGLICGIGALSLGIIALLVCCIPVVGMIIGAAIGFVGVILGIVSVVLSKIAKGNKGFAIAGLVCSILSMSGTIFFALVGYIAGNA